MMSQIRKRGKKSSQSQPTEQNGASAAIGPSFFYEDEVFRVNKNGDAEFGMVTENWDMYSSDEDEEDDEFNTPDKVPHGSVAVTWFPKTKDEVLAESKVKLSDRSLMPGDVVRRLIAGKDTQRGYCRSVRVAADLHILGTKKIVLGVPATTLLPVQKLQAEIAVYMDSWIGVVRDVKNRVTLKFADGSSCVTDSDVLLDNFEEIRNNTEYHESEVFYPGQKLRGRMKYLKDADYSYITDELKRTKDKKTVNLVVLDVQPLSLNIQWQWQTPGTSLQATPNMNMKPPPEVLTGEDIKRVQCLNLFESCTVQLCDISYYTPTTKDVVLDKSEWKKKVLGSLNANDKKSVALDDVAGNCPKDDEDDEAFLSDENAEATKNNKSSVPPTDSDKQATKVANSKKAVPKVCTRSLRKKKLKKAVRQQPQPKVESEGLTVVETVHTQSLVDVVWQDGTYEEAMRSVDLYPIHHLDDHEFFPGDFVVNAESNDFKTYGVIQRMDHCGRVAVVKWFETYSFNGEQKPKQLDEVEMSVYDIKDHPDFRFRPGTIVIRVANMQDQQCPAGQILDNYPDGQVRVWWANGAIACCWPQDLFRLGEYDSDDEIWDDNENDGQHHTDTDTDDNPLLPLKEDEGANSDSSWETETEDEPNNEAAEASLNRYHNIGLLIERIQKTLVNTRETIVASSSVSINEDGTSSGGVTEVASSTPVAKVKLGNFDERGLTKKLLLIYKDCQYLDKIMGSKFFDIEDLKKWRNSNQNCSARSKRIVEQISRLFDVPRTPSDSSVPALDSLDDGEHKMASSSKEDLTTCPDQGVILVDLCSVILNKLVDAHSAYEKQFGNSKLGNLNASQLLKDTKDDLQLLVEGLDAVGFLDPAGDAAKVTKESEKNEINALDLPPVVGMDSITIDLPMSALDCSTDSSNFSFVDKVPDTHRYRLTSLLPQNQRQFVKCVQREVSLLRESLPEGIYVKGFEDRMDLYSVMIEGPEKTPYEDGLFMFDIQLPPAYPTVPPLVHYIAFCTDKLNPNLYEEGKVCVSLLGTWNGKGTEVWGTSSSLLQLLVSIQGLILNPEPYYNEAGYEKQKGTQQGAENSRMYNENVLIKLMQSMSRIIVSPATAWEKESLQYIKTHGPRMVERYQGWLELKDADLGVDNIELPPFPLLPVSKGFQITLTKSIASFAKLLTSIQ